MIQRKSQPMIRRQILVIMTALVIAFTGQAMAQKPTDAQLEDALWNCLSKRIPGTDRDAGDHTRAFNPNTGQNFVYDKDKNAWIDAKTGEAICPKSTTSAGLEDSFWNCLSERIPGTDRDAGDHTRAFDPNTGRNFVYDKDKGAWIDAKTGECLCPKCPPPSIATTPAPAGVGFFIVEPRAFFDLVEKADASTAGVPKPSEETQKVEEKKSGVLESIFGGFGFGIGGGREDRERRFPDDPRR
jgi:hypothetical protein